MNRLVLVVATAAAALIAPTAAHAAEGVSVNSGVMTVIAGTGTVDAYALSTSSSGTIISDTASPGGAVGKRCTALSTTSAICTGATSVDVQARDLDDSIVNGSALPGRLDGGAGNDDITGAVTAETIVGGEGNDVIAAGLGQDTVDAGAGADQVDVRDGGFDAVVCGEGNDTVYADAGDFLFGCETINPVVVNADGTVTSTDPVGPSTGSTSGGGSDDPTSDKIDASGLLAPVTVAGPVTANLRMGESIAVGSSGKAPLVLGCASDERTACAGVIFIDPLAGRAKGKKSKKARQSASAFMARRGRYGSSPFKVKPGAEDKVDVKLTGIALKALGKKSRRRKARAARRGRSVRAVVTIAPRKARAQRVTIVLKG